MVEQVEREPLRSLAADVAVISHLDIALRLAPTALFGSLIGFAVTVDELKRILGVWGGQIRRVSVVPAAGDLEHTSVASRACRGATPTRAPKP